MPAQRRTTTVQAFCLITSLLIALLIPWAADTISAAPQSYYVSPTGSDTNNGRSPSAPFKTIQKALDLAQPGAQITLADGVYLQDAQSVRDGNPAAPILISGSPNAIVQGAGSARIIEINHDYITLSGFTLDGLWGDPNVAAGYRDKLLYVLGKQPRDGVNGLRVLHMTLRNAGGECIRLRYFAHQNEIAYSSISTCGVHDFRFMTGGKNGEGIYIGTAPEQRDDGKNPTNEPDVSTHNWIHDNSFNTHGNECVDLKEATTANLVEHNTCTGQRDPKSGGFDSRGNGNVFRSNESYGNAGFGMRLGGDEATDGINNYVYNNNIHDNQSGGVSALRWPQAQVCGNTMANNLPANAVGNFGSLLDPTAPCSEPVGPPPCLRAQALSSAISADQRLAATAVLSSGNQLDQSQVYIPVVFSAVSICL